MKFLKNTKTVYQDENNVVLDENNVERKPCINKESKSLELTIGSYSCHNINMKFLVVVTPPSIYHGCSTRKTFWEERFTGKQYLFESVNMRLCGRRKVRKHIEIKGSDKCVTLNIYEILNISEKFDDLNNMETTSTESKVELEISGKGLVTSLDLKTKVRSEKYKKARYAIGNVSMKDLSNKIKDFEKMVKVPYVKRIPKHEPTSSYFHLFVCLGECMMIWSDNNHHVHNSYKEEMAPSSEVNDTDEDESNNSIVH